MVCRDITGLTALGGDKDGDRDRRLTSGAVN